MGDNPKQLLSVLHSKIKQLILMSDALRYEKATLTEELDRKEQTIATLRQELEELNIKYQNLKTARNLSFGEGDVKEARNRFNKLVREIDKCISLLNE